MTRCMIRRWLLSLFLGVSLFSAATLAGEDPLFVPQSVVIPKKLRLKPAADLVAPSGEIWTSDDWVDPQKSKQDISFLDPASTDVWGDPTFQREVEYPVPTGKPLPGEEIRPDQEEGVLELRLDPLVKPDSVMMGSPIGLARARVVTDDAQAKAYRIAFNWNLRSSLMNAELLKKLGYTVDIPRHYSRGRIRFPDLVTRNRFMDALEAGTGSTYDRWVAKEPEKDDLVIEFQDFVLEPARIATPAYYWGMLSPLEFQDRRAVRALIIPTVLTYVPESVNLWTWEFGKLIGESVVLYHPFAGNFQGQATYEDSRWIARQICAISEDGLRDVVRAGHWDPSMDRLMLEKLKSRRNHLMKLFDVECDRLDVKSKLTYRYPENDGKLVVKNGELLQGKFPGISQIFTGPDPLSPLRRDELFRYLRLEGVGAALRLGLDQLSDKVTKYTNTDLHQTKGPNWAFEGGPSAGLRFGLTRKVVTGTYYGSEAPIQLVDQFSMSLKLGYFLGAKNRALEQLTIGLEPNVGISRSYVHVKPVLSIKEAVKTPWKDAPVIWKLKALARMLNAKSRGEESSALDQFLQKFLPGENFSIVDSIDFGARVSARLPTAPFLPLSTTGKLSASGGYDHVILRRTMIQRLADGTIQISLQRVKKRTLDVSIGYSFIVDLVEAEANRNSGDSDADVYVLDPTRVEDAEKLTRALRRLLKSNDSEALEKNFHPFDMDHDLKARMGRLKLLPWSFVRKHEEHSLAIIPPRAPRTDQYARQLFAIRDRRLSGNDLVGTGTRTSAETLVNFLLPDLNADFAPSSGGKDPSTRFMGRSHWKELRTEAEVTPGEKSMTLITFQEVYQGWGMKRDRMLRILKRLEGRATEVNGVAPALIHYDEFLSTERLLMYSIQSKLLIAGPGVDALAVLARESKSFASFATRLASTGRAPSRAPWLEKLYRRLIDLPVEGSSIEQNKERIVRLHGIAKILANEVGVKGSIQLIGTENAFYQIDVSGFRKGDENGDSRYVSDSIGQLNPDTGLGAYVNFIETQKVSAYETYGVYLGDGT